MRRSTEGDGVAGGAGAGAGRGEEFGNFVVVQAGNERAVRTMTGCRQRSVPDAARRRCGERVAQGFGEFRVEGGQRDATWEAPFGELGEVIDVARDEMVLVMIPTGLNPRGRRGSGGSARGGASDRLGDR